MYVDTLDHFAGVAEKKAGLLRNNPSSFFIGSMMAGAYVGLGIILIFTLGTFVDPSVRKLAMGGALGDGLPLVPPTRQRLEAMLAAVAAPHQSHGQVPCLLGELTAATVAYNCVLAGCQAAELAVVLTAAEACLEPCFNLLGILTTTGAPAVATKHVLEEKVGVFPPDEQRLCEELREIYSPETLAKVKRCLPDGDLTFCHNDTYHGNIMKLHSGEIKLLNFEFSCLNHKAYDFSNPFAETVMRHQQPDYPYFRIAEPEFGDRELSTLINFYLDNADFETSEAREIEFQKLLQDAKHMLPMSDYKYAMAALPLAVEPIQKIRFIPYAHQRFARFLRAYEQRFGGA